jgi:DNA-binding response OmpR family regulator
MGATIAPAMATNARFLAENAAPSTRPRGHERRTVLLIGNLELEQQLRPLRADGFELELGAASAGARPRALAVVDVSHDAGPEAALTARIRSVPATHVVVVTAPGHAARISALEAGADTVMSAPVHQGELLARVRAGLRRVQSDAIRIAGDLSLDREKRTVHGPRGRITARTREFDLLWAMMGRPSAVFTRTGLATMVWGNAIYANSRTIDVHVGQLRAKLAHEGVRARLVTVWGVGYRLEVDPA